MSDGLEFKQKEDFCGIWEPPGKLHFIQPTQYKWKWTLTHWDEFCIQVPTAPCWFHRLMQRIILGIKWERIKYER